MTAQRLRRRNPATVAARPVTSLATALTQAPPDLVALADNLADTLAAVEAAAGKNVTNAARSAILLVTAPKVVDPTAEGMEANKGVTEAVTEVDVKVARLATLAADTDTCRATVPKDRSATTVSSKVIHDHTDANGQS